MRIGRRELVLGGLASLGGLTCGSALASESETLLSAKPARLRPAHNPSSTLTLYHIHTTEALKVDYRENGAILTAALEAIDYELRDFRTGGVMPIDVDLLDTLSLLYDQFGRRGRYEVISGYRSPRTNAALRHVTTGVAENSNHMYGRAIDVRLVGTETTHLRDAALALGRGGVGYYPESNFVHIDTGPVRSW